MKKNRYVVSVMARDRVGIISDVTRAVYELGGNVDAMSQTVLSGYFTLILTVTCPGNVDPQSVRESVSDSSKPGELNVEVCKWLSGDDIRDPGGNQPFTLTIMGPDRRGVVYDITSFLAGRQVNIIDQYAYTKGKDFVFVAQVHVPSSLDPGQLSIDLEKLWRESGIQVRFQHENIFLATNRVDFAAGRPAGARKQ